MQIQKSFSHQSATLFLVSTPIGNLSDMTPRAVETLKSVAIIASEDTRVTKKLCNYFEIQTPLTSYHEHNKNQKTEYLLERLANGEDVALVSDAGMPLISDPGDKLVESATHGGFAVVSIPGANAALTALVASGLPTQPFLFHGFVERQKAKKKAELQTLEQVRATIIFYESPHRLKETLTAMLEIFGNRKVVVARELTKMYEEYLRGTINEILTHLNEVKGEIVLIVEGNSSQPAKEEWWLGKSLQEHIEYYISEGLKTNNAIKQAAVDLGRTRQEVYKEYHNE